jgi:hypothetical protein
MFIRCAAAIAALAFAAAFARVRGGADKVRRELVLCSLVRRG